MISCNFNLVSSILAYLVSSVGGVAVVKLLNYRYCFTSWWTLALLSRSTWLLSLSLHVWLQWWESTKISVSSRQLRLYLLIALGLATVEVLNAFSMTMLPGNMYMLLKGSDVGWSMVLSYILLGKKYVASQIAAATLIMVGIGLVFIPDQEDGQAKRSNADTTSNSYRVTVLFSAICCISAAFLNSLCAVGTEATLKQTLREEECRLLNSSMNCGRPPPSKLLLSNAYSMWTNFFSFVLLVLPVSIRAWKGHHDFSSLGDEVCKTASIKPTAQIDGKNSMFSSGISEAPQVMIVFFLGLLGVSRFMERLSKYFICLCDSAMTFSVVQAARRFAGIYIIGLVFQEDFPFGIIMGSLCGGIGFALHAWGSQSSRTTVENETPTYQKVATTNEVLTPNTLDASYNGEIELKNATHTNT